MEQTESSSTLRPQNGQRGQTRKRSTLRRVSSILAIAMVLPAGGMAADGFLNARPLLGLLGLAIMITFGAGYYFLLDRVLENTPD
ncbi:MAG: hypothetical protein ABSG46_04605 [Candidatus Binataceae bacterium]|jgi:hypothetical protein